MKIFSDLQDLNVSLPHTIPEKATGGWTAPNEERHRIQGTGDQHRKTGGRKFHDGGK